MIALTDFDFSCTIYTDKNRESHHAEERGRFTVTRTKKLAGAVVAAVLLAAVLGAVLWQSGRHRADLEALNDISYYDQFLFAEGTDVAALLERATAPENRLGSEAEGVRSYDPAVLAPSLPNGSGTSGMEVFQVEELGEVTYVNYSPVQPAGCTRVSLACVDGRVVTVVAAWGEDGPIVQADLDTGAVTVYEPE